MNVIECGYRPRAQFVPFHKRSARFYVLVAHRRAGKTVAAVHDLHDGALRCDRPRPRFAYIAPYYRQAKSVAWDYLREAVSPLREIGATVHESELRVDYPHGGQVRLFGADNADSLRGLYFDGVVCDEVSQFDPRVWPEIIRPALSDRLGWAAFIGTPAGRNQFFELYDNAVNGFRQADGTRVKDPDWAALMLRASSTDILPQGELDAARRAMTEDAYAQEYECSFDAAVRGAYYGKLMRQAEEAKRICGVPYDPAARVWTAWDLGFRDATAVWFAQVVGREIHLIDYYESVEADISQDVREVLRRPYVFAGHIVPHDAYATEKQTGKTTVQFMEGLGMRDITRAPDTRVEDGISAVQLAIPRMWFDAARCARGIDALKLYRADYDDKAQTLKQRPVHDWTSHAADAMRYLAVTLDRTVDKAGFGREIKYRPMGLA